MLCATPSASAVRGSRSRVRCEVTEVPRPVGSAPLSWRMTGQSRNVLLPMEPHKHRDHRRRLRLGTALPLGGLLVAQAFVVPDDLGDDEAQEGLGEDRVEARVIGQGAQTPDLVLLAGRIGRGQAVGGLEDPDALGVPEPFGQQVHQSGVDVVDAAAFVEQELLCADGVVRAARGVAGAGRCGRHQALRSCWERSWARSESLVVTISGPRPSVTTPAVITTLAMSSREGTSNMTGCSDSSRMARSPRAPVPRSMAFSAMASRALASKSSSTPSRANIFWYCLTRALRGSVRILMSAGRSRSDTLVITGRRPMNSGISPKVSRSSGWSWP